MAESKICTCPQCGKKFKVSADADAASFACSACGATVWINGKPKTPAGGRRKTTGGRAAPKGRGGGKTRGRAGGGGKAPAARGRAAPAAREKGQRRGRSPVAGFTDEEGAHHGRAHRKKEDNSNVIIAVIGLVVIIGLVAFFLMSGDDPKPTDSNQEQATKKTGTTDKTGGAGMTDTDGAPKDPPADNGSDTGTAENPTETDPGATGAGDAAATDPEKKDPPKKLNASKSKYKMVNGKRVRVSRYNPPEDLVAHLESTPADKRKEIDDLINTLFDPDAGSDCFRAKKKLIVAGKPAFIPILQRMIVTKKLLKWDRSIEDNQTLSSVRLADETLREMDGWIEAKNVRRIVPGSDERYYDYVLRIYYRRWLTELKDLDTMPGPYDPASEYKGENEEEE